MPGVVLTQRITLFTEFVYGTQNNDDMAGIEADIPKIVEVNQGLFISGLFRNLGSNTLAAADFNYRVNGGNVVSTVSAGNLPVATGAYKTLSSSTQWTPSSDGKYEIEMWMSQLNGSADGDNSNDTIKLDVYATSNPPNRKVVIEERTGTWCQWCPRGTVSMEIMSRERHNSTVLIAVHNADPMALPAYDPNLSGGFPTFTGDRIFSEQSISSDASNMKKFDDERQKLVPEASVKITNLNYNSGTGALAVDMESEFVVDAPNSDYRYVVVLTEDGVTGTSGGYAQVNAYSGSSQLTLVGPDGRVLYPATKSHSGKSNGL
ncbi:MAG: hypothetical protein U5L96_19975 [Owenweeksia sp.]|nr:hypothetical protein [Owenweeksia sp.]